jgi:hypothetical protein
MPPEFERELLVGEELSSCRPLVPYAPLACDFLGSLSQELRADRRVSAYPDVMAFAFWCRAAHIEKLKAEFDASVPAGRARIGLGRVFHITPSNVPVNFAFSFVFGLLSGNANVVRVPSKPYPQTDIICSALHTVLALGRFAELRAMTAFVRYGHSDSITGAYSATCNARIIWGGDVAIQNIRKLPMPERGVDIAFADRYSFAVLGAPAVLALDDAGLVRLAEHFYNDAFLMDQNACSSPHLIVWQGAGQAPAAKARFWEAVGRVAEKKYSLSQFHAVDKLTHLCQDAIDCTAVAGFSNWANYVYCIHLQSLPSKADDLRGRFGYFYEYAGASLDELAPIVNARYQTLTYFGVDKQVLLDFVLAQRLTGIDRIVPVGNALDIGVIWDGYDIIASLSRIIDVL